MRGLRYLLVIFSVLFCCVFVACDASGGDKPTENGRMEEVKDDSGTLTGYERRFYNQNGDVTRLDVFDENETYLYYILYEYDDNNRLYTETRYKAEGFGDSRYVYTYDDDGNLAEKAYELPHGEAEIYRYDTDGNEIERLYYGSDEKLIKHEVLEDGKWIIADTEPPTE